MSASERKVTKIAVIGLGYVGCVTAACFAQNGFEVVGIDKDHFKVDNINSGIAPFYEPGLQEIIAKAKTDNLIYASTDIGLINDCDVAMICVGTPSAVNGNLGLDQLNRVVSEMVERSKTRTKELIVALRSTVFPGTCEEHLIAPFKGNPLVKVVSNPEFLREGTAIKDFLYPSLIVVGGNDSVAVERVAELYADLPMKVSKVELRTAEMIKYACNSFHAVKISFANEIGVISAAMGINPEEVMETVCLDTKLNVSKAYLKPGFSFGGSCLPKDLRALMYRAKRLDLDIPMLTAVLPSNEEHLARAVRTVLAQPKGKLGIVGLAFKEDTDDLRESPVVYMLETLIGKGRELRIYDPHITMDSIYGSNKNYISSQIPHIGALMSNALEEVLQWADSLVIAQNLSAEMMKKIEASGLPVVNLVEPTLSYLRP